DVIRDCCSWDPRSSPSRNRRCSPRPALPRPSPPFHEGKTGRGFLLGSAGGDEFSTRGRWFAFDQFQSCHSPREKDLGTGLPLGDRAVERLPERKPESVPREKRDRAAKRLRIPLPRERRIESLR